jgi:hypothetical protein
MPIPLLTITAGAWVWDKYGKTFADKTAGAAKSRWEKFKWKDAAEEYRKKIKKLYGTMQIMGMAEPVPLDDIFTEAFMLDKPTAFSRFDIERIKETGGGDPDAPPERVKRINGLRLVVEKDTRQVVENGKRVAIETARNLFILGKPGAGKTTFLKYIAVKAAEQTINKIPIFVSLKQWADSGSELLPFIAERFDICDFPAAQPFVEELLKSGNAMVLFDGLDEVSRESGQRDKQTFAMNNFVEKYDRTQCLITCRIAASDYSFQPFTYVEIADFTEAQIQAFVGNWFRKDGEKDEETRDKFLAEFAREDNKGLRNLARTPLLLTLLCLAFNERLTFPQRRVEIYEEAIEALLKKWDSSRRIKRDEVYRKLSLGHKENMLARIAAETFEKNEYFIPQPELERRITDYIKNVPPHETNEATDGEAILKAIEAHHGIFVERAHEVYSFSHLTFQEYFTAKYIVANATKRTLTNLVKAHCTDKRWREVFLLTTSLLLDASRFMEIFRHGVDVLIEGDGGVRELLTWADNKSASIQANPPSGRSSYLYMALYYPGRRHFLNHYYEPSLEHERLDFTLIENLISIIDFARYYDFAVEHSDLRSFELARLRSHVLDFDISYIRKLGLNVFADELGALPTPTDKAPARDWHEFARKSRDLIIKHRDIGREWGLSKIQEARLGDFIIATGLLHDCLQLATMPPDQKRTMMNNLYLPLAQAEDGQNA